MSNTDILRDQHGAALAMAQRLLELIEDFRPGASGDPILMQLNRLYGIVRVHLAQEDVELYPALLASPDPMVARTARKFVDDMGDLAVDLEWFARHWSSTASIVGNFAEFRHAANELVLRLAVRIDLETRLLYPLAEAGPEPRRNAA